MPNVLAVAATCLALCLSGPSLAFAQVTAEEALARSRWVIGDPGCGDARPDEIVICGRNMQRYRLHGSDDRGDAGRVARGEVPGASPDRLLAGKCGIFAGERRCGKAEAQAAGYGGGRDPVTLLLKLVTAIADPDADLAPHPPVPRMAKR